MAYPVNKGADRPSEVAGIQGGDYLLILAGSAMGLMIITTLLIVLLDVPSWALFGGFLITVVLIQGVLVRLSRQYGENGFSRMQARKRRPGIITVRSPKVYRQLRQR